MPSIPKTKNIQQRNNLRELRTKKKKIRDKKTMQIVKKKLKSKSLDNVF